MPLSPPQIGNVIPTHVRLQADGVTALCHPSARGWSGCLEPPSPGHGAAARASQGESRARTEELFVLPPGPVVYRQPELFTSAAGRDLRHGHPDVGPSPGCTPRSPGAGEASLGRRGSGDEG